MFSNLYVFIIWNRARWCERKIILDLAKDFNIIYNVEANWENGSFEDGLKAFYGAKMLYPNDKKRHCGEGDFRIIIIEDSNPVIEPRDTSAGVEYVNAKVFDKKMLYRKWTGAGHRIHCSNTDKETNYNLTVIMGADWRDRIAGNYQERITLRKSIFENEEVLRTYLRNVGNNVFINFETYYLILAKSRMDVLSSLYIFKDSTGPHILNDGDVARKLYVFGEDENELPEGIVDLAEVNVNGIIDYNFVDVCDVDDLKSVCKFFSQYGLEYKDEISKKKYSRQNVYDRLKDNIKLLLCKIRYGRQ